MEGTGSVTDSLSVNSGIKKRWALGSSTSQSNSATGILSFNETARLAATVVFPVPPFPLAMAIIMFSPPFGK
jgi:hypothetical protein